MDQNVDFSGSDQIQTPQYPEVYPPSEISNEYSKPENPNELFQKLLGDLKELAEYENSQSRDRPIFLNDDENHSVQNNESLENSSDEIVVSNSNEEKEGPSQESDIHKLIREECCVEVCEEQKQNMEDTILKLVKICQEKEFLCIHDNVDDLIESALNTLLLLINSQLAPILSTKEPEYSSSMWYENSNTESDEIIKSGVEEVVPILSKNEVTLEDKRECDVPVCENYPICDDHSEIFSKDDDDISVYDDFKDIEYVEASLSNPEIISIVEENVIHQEEEEVDLEDISQILDDDLREKLLSITHLISNIESLNNNPTPDCVLNSFKSDNSLLDNFSPKFKTFCDLTKETRSEGADLFLASYNSIPPGIENIANDSEGDIRFLEELLIDDSILSHESSESNFKDNTSVPLPPPEPPDAETDAGEEIPVVMNDKDKFDEDYHFFMFDKVFSLLSTESEDTIFDPGISA
nr:hypothetical protein [Tanacetum cinerariifolium]